MIEACLNTGWYIDESDPTALILMPPLGDPRRNWKAEWEKVKHDNKTVLVPNWASPMKYPL